MTTSRLDAALAKWPHPDSSAGPDEDLYTSDYGDALECVGSPREIITEALEAADEACLIRNPNDAMIEEVAECLYMSGPGGRELHWEDVKSNGIKKHFREKARRILRNIVNAADTLPTQ